MRIEFISHSSLLTESGAVSLLCDPWLDGTAFNDGRALLSPVRFDYEEFARITHIWFSHEHPDHFAPANLRRIPAPLRKRIRVLFQQTTDKKVVTFCSKLGFADVQELPLARWVDLAPGFEIMCGAAGHGDSWLAIRADGKTLLNTNDCPLFGPDSAASIRDLVGDVDALATQFSLSSWEGNPGEVERRRAGAQTMLERCVFQTKFFNARQVIPFASFVWLCHEENYFMNAELTRVDRVADELRARTQCLPCVMYPGDSLSVGLHYDGASAIRRYLMDVEGLQQRPRIPPRHWTTEELVEAGRSFRKSLLARASLFRLELGLARAQILRAIDRMRRERTISALASLAHVLLTLRPRPARVYVWDHAQAYLLDLRNGFRAASLKQEECELSCGADSLVYAFKYLWGGMTLQINGRFHETSRDSHRTMFDYFHLANWYNQGGAPNWRTVMRRILRLRQ